VKVLLTGIAGFGGAALARRLVVEGYDVVGCDTVAPEEAWRLRDLIDDGRLTYLWTAVEDLHPGSELGRPDTVVHMAAVADVSAGHHSPTHTVRTNVMGAVHVLELCRRWDPAPHFILAGTAHELEAAGDVLLDEDSPIQPGTPYGFSKAAQELAVRTWGHAYGLPWTVMRNGIVVGRTMRRQIAPYLWCRRILQGLPTHLDDPTQTRDVTDARDTVEAWFRTIEMPREYVVGRVLQVSRGVEVTVRGLLEMCYSACERIVGHRLPRQIEIGLPRPGEAGMRERFDTSRTRALLQWTPRYSPEDTIADVARWAAEELGMVPARGPVVVPDRGPVGR
jgi:nucleoside-diphosphate-sugar epimerase